MVTHAYIVVRKGRDGKRDEVYGYGRWSGPPKTFLALGVKAKRMSEADARALAASLAASFPAWEWIAMSEEDFR